MLRDAIATAWRWGCLGLMAAALVACATLWDPATHGVSVQAIGTDAARIVNVHLFARKDDLLLTGEVDVDSNHPMLMEMPGRVDVEVTGADGGVIASYRPDGYKNLHDHYETYQRFVFSVVLPVIPANGDVIRLIYRDGGASEMKM
jgi:hypothetical protein